MDQPADLLAQATELRHQGFSHSQIGRRLGVHKSVIARWVAAVSFDGFNDESRAEQLSAVRDPHLYNRALELRQAGWSYKMIEAEIGVARSTLSGWLRHVPLTDQHAAARKATWETAQQKAIQANRLKREGVEAEIQAGAAQDIQDKFPGQLAERDLFIIGLMLYGPRAQKQARWSA